MDNLHHHQSDDEQMREEALALYERVYGKNKSVVDELIRLSGIPDEKEHFETLLEDVAFEALKEHEEFTHNAMKMRSGGLSKEQQLTVRDRQRELLSLCKVSILSEAGIDTDAAKTDFDLAKAHVKEIVDSITSSSEGFEAVDILSEMGIIAKDENGEDIFQYPPSLFPQSTDKKWGTYLESVRAHLRTERAVHAGTLGKEALGEADRLRRYAHNAVSRDVHEILGFSWDFEDTRNLVAKMRDSRFPTVETGEAFRTGKAVAEGALGVAALNVMLTNLADLHK